MIFITELTDKKVSVAILNNILYSISWVHTIADLEGPCKSNLIIKMRQGAKRILAKPVAKKEPYLPRNIKKYSHVLWRRKEKLYELKIHLHVPFGILWFF